MQSTSFARTSNNASYEPHFHAPWGNPAGRFHSAQWLNSGRALAQTEDLQESVERVDSRKAGNHSGNRLEAGIMLRNLARILDESSNCLRFDVVSAAEASGWPLAKASGRHSRILTRFSASTDPPAREHRERGNISPMTDAFSQRPHTSRTPPRDKTDALQEWCVALKCTEPLQSPS